MSPLDGELLRAAAGASLVVLRAWAILQAQVLWRSVLGRVWWLVAAGLALVLAPLAGPVPPVGSLPAWALAAAAELLLGTAIGTIASLPGYALLGASTATAAALRVATRPFVATFVVVALTAGLSLGLHRPLLASFAALHEQFPVGDPSAWVAILQADGLRALLAGLETLLLLALALATPVLLTAAVVDVGLRLVGRGPTPAAAVVDPIRVWARFAGALAALGASWATFGDAWARSMLPG